MSEMHETQLEFLRSSLLRDLQTFRDRRAKNRRTAFVLKMTVSLSGAITTVLLGLKSSTLLQGAGDYLVSIALITSSIATLMTTWEAFFDHRWLWIKYTATLSDLYAIWDDLEFAAASGEITATDLADLHGRRQHILAAVNNAWSQKREGESGSQRK